MFIPEDVLIRIVHAIPFPKDGSWTQAARRRRRVQSKVLNILESLQACSWSQEDVAKLESQVISHDWYSH